MIERKREKKEKKNSTLPFDSILSLLILLLYVVTIKRRITKEKRRGEFGKVDGKLLEGREKKSQLINK